ncbi:MAG: ABC transporter ATP-binding protein, partial [Vicinamibacterales bacterium]
MDGRSSAIVHRSSNAGPAIEVSRASKIYRRYSHRKQFATLKSALLSRSLITTLRPDETFTALNDVTLTVPKGRTLGVIGRNGSGKSTLLKLVAGITKPSTGTVRVNGRVSALIELGAGFHPEISGRENVFINGIMLGLTKREVARRFDDIVEFAELTEFIDAPVKTYSSGMYMRLGFAVAINVDPDVLLVDEVLAVGDEGFTHKCLDKFGEFKRRGKTILLVTHSLGMVERFCDEAVWLDHGEKKAQGDTTRVIGSYVSDVARQEETLLATSDQRAQQSLGELAPGTAPLIETGATSTDMTKAAEGRWGSGFVTISDVRLTDPEGMPSHVFTSGAPVVLRFKVHAKEPVIDFAFGVGLFNADGIWVYGTNTDVESFEADELRGDNEVALLF